MLRRLFDRQAWLERLFGRKKKSRKERREAFQSAMLQQLRIEPLEDRRLLAGVYTFDNASFNAAEVDVTLSDIKLGHAIANQGCDAAESRRCGS